MSALWPTSVATDADLYVAKNSLQTTLATALGTGDVTVVLASATGFPVAGGVVIGNEVIFYTNISGASLTGCTRGADGTTATAHSVGVPVGAAILAFHHNGLMAEIEAIETFLNTVLGKSTTVTATEFGYVHGVTSAIQTQFSAKAPLASPTFTGTPVMPNIAITDTSNQLVIGTTRTVTITAPTPATTSRVWTIPDIASDATFGALEGTQTFTGTKTFNDFRGTFGANIAAGSHKITGLANGTASTDAAAFGQVKYLQTIFATTTTRTSTTSTSFVDTSLTATITPTSASSRIKVSVSGTLDIGGAASQLAYATIKRGSTNIGDATSGIAVFFPKDSSTESEVPCSMLAVDSPATTSATTYTVQIKSSSGSATAKWLANNSQATIILEEIV